MSDRFDEMAQKGCRECDGYGTVRGEVEGGWACPECHRVSTLLRQVAEEMKGAAFQATRDSLRAVEAMMSHACASLRPSQSRHDQRGEMKEAVSECAVSAKLLDALLGCRRTDGRGGHIDCWCDSERGAAVINHAPYCLDAQDAVRAVKQSHMEFGTLDREVEWHDGIRGCYAYKSDVFAWVARYGKEMRWLLREAVRVADTVFLEAWEDVDDAPESLEKWRNRVTKQGVADRIDSFLSGKTCPVCSVSTSGFHPCPEHAVAGEPVRATDGPAGDISTRQTRGEAPDAR